MSIQLSKQELCAVVSGTPLFSSHSVSINGVEFDSRKVQGGELFIALPGANQHGHLYVSEVFSRGASLALVEDEELFRSHPEKERIVVVPSTLKAFWTLARWWKNKRTTPLLGITGSVGKTTVKDMCAAILLEHSPGIFSLRSYNNHTGLPYTLCKLSAQHEWCITEIGMNAPGEIQQLVQIASPAVVVITEIAPAHMVAFESLELVAQAKLEILDGTPSPHTLVIPAGNNLLENGLKAKGQADIRKEYFSENAKEEAACKVIQLESLGLAGWEVVLDLFDEQVSFRLPLLGKHNVRNAACAALAAKCFMPEITTEEISSGLGKLRSPQMRLERIELESGAIIIDDSYNANPASMKSALGVMKDLCDAQDSKKIGLILGEMLELGEKSAEYHLELGEWVASLCPNFLIALGEHSDQMIEGCRRAGIPYFKVESAEAAAHTAKKYGFDYLLVKGSRGMGLDRSIEVLVEQIGLKPPSSGGDFSFR